MPRRRTVANTARRRQLKGPHPPRLSAWLAQHRKSAGSTLQQLLRQPVATLMTAAVVAIALALPTALFVVAENVKALGGDWQPSAAVSLFLETGIDETAGAALKRQIADDPAVTSVELISRAEGLTEFREYSGLGSAVDQLIANPLPVVLEVHLRPGALEETVLEPLLSRLQSMPEVQFLREDAEWAQRFEAMLELLQSGAALLAILLGLGVLLVVGNTIRLEIENHREAIRILCLVGATAAFARRPFLYSGAWYGLLGGSLAWLLVSAMIWLLEGQVAHLASLYHTSFALRGLGPAEVPLLLASSTLLGVLGSWIATARHLGIADAP